MTARRPTTSRSRRCAPRARASGPRAHRGLSRRSSSPTELEPRKNVVTSGSPSAIRDLARAARGRAASASATCSTRATRVAARDRTARAGHHRRGGDRRATAPRRSAAALLDYDDLIDKTLRAASAAVDAAWVHYKLDRGIDHVLIDEAQDTSPRQWEIIEPLVAEFSAGGGARDVKRTIFAVGDEKQSIFSFQGAAPQAFDEMRRHFERAVRPRRSWAGAICASSTRSAPAPTCSARSIAVFSAREVYRQRHHRRSRHPGAPAAARCGARAGRDLAADRAGRAARDRGLGRAVRHAERGQARRCCSPAASPHDGASASIDRRAGRRPATCWCWCASAARCSRRSSARSRTPISPVAGADRLVLTEHIAVMDLMALADALLLPDDDLALASVLKSPLFGLTRSSCSRSPGTARLAARGAARQGGGRSAFAATEQALAELAKRRGSCRRSASMRMCSAPARAREDSLRASGRRPTTRSTSSSISRSTTRRRETPSLQGFLAWLRAARSEIKRDMEIVRDEVRVMTVHGAKGLEAQTVILADTTTPPAGPHDPRAAAACRRRAWSGRARKAEDVDVMARARARLRARPRATNIAGCSMSR